jgi:hypothetical protein
VKAKRLRDGARLTFTDVERETLVGLLADMAEALGDAGLRPGDPVYDRLYPAGYSGVVDEQAQREFRELTNPGLRDERVTRITTCRDELAASADQQGRVELDDTGCDRWLRVLNDLRLTLGTRLEISDDDGHWQLAQGAAGSTAYLLYGWLTEVQDTVVRIALK